MEGYEYEYVVEGEDYPQDAIKFKSAWSPDEVVEYIADDAAMAFYDVDPDPECFPLDLEVYSNGENIGQFRVELEYEPSFNSEKK